MDMAKQKKKLSFKFVVAYYMCFCYLL